VLVQTFAATELDVLPYTCYTKLISAQLRTTVNDATIADVAGGAFP
jgi:hypothetical protein